MADASSAAPAEGWDGVTELERERATLGKAERDIVDGERRVGEQELLIERLRGRGRPLDAAEGLLATLRGTLEEWRHHRREILRRIDHLAASTET